jgi:hypothetical protein
MPQITIPPVFVSGSPMSADAWNGALYGNEGTPDNVAGALNGFLDLTNLDPGETITADEVGSRQITQARLVSRTVNCDYFVDVFPANDPNDVDVRDSLAQGIAGAGITFYVPKEARAVVFGWHVSVFPVQEPDDVLPGPDPDPQYLPLPSQNAAVFLTPWLNGVPQRRLERRLAETIWAYRRPRGTLMGAFQASRFWTGHWIYEKGMSDSGLWPKSSTGLPATLDKKPTDAGWHTFGIRVSSVAKQARIRTCRMHYNLIF